MDSNCLDNLANSLFLEINSNKDPFITPHIIVPNLFIEQWLKAYWLKSQEDKVLMNVDIISINDGIRLLSEQDNYKLINRNDLKSLIISILNSDIDLSIPEELKEYYESSLIKLDDFASNIADLLLSYYLDNFEGLGDYLNSYQYRIYQEVVSRCKNLNIGTLELPIPKKNISGNYYLFGFAKLENVYSNFFSNCPYVKQFNLVNELDSRTYEVSKAPSKVREIEYIHSQICHLLLEGYNTSDIVVFAPKISEYVHEIERVFTQDDLSYPSIPYVIRSSEKSDSDVSIGLKKLFQIIQNKFFSRNDLYSLLSNPVIQQARNINEEDIDDYFRTIVDLNLFRNHDFLNDWLYLKKRLLLSKLSSINFSDNIVSLSDNDYIPYSSIPFNDDNILKVVNLIDDLFDLINLYNSQLTINNDFIDAFKTHLDRWFSYSKEGESETNKIYIKVLRCIDTFKKIDNSNIPTDIFYTSIYEASMTNTVQNGFAFTSGITFSDISINSVISSKNIFLIGMSSNNIPLSTTKSELDLRATDKIDDSELTISLLKNNALDHFYVSYVYLDLKNEEEFFISPIISNLNDICRVNEIKEIPLDEKRDYKELFTSKEFIDKQRYFELFKAKNSKSKKMQGNSLESTPIFYEAVTASQMTDYLKEPLAAKAKFTFGYKDDLQEKIHINWEPFNIESIKSSNLIKEIIELKINNSFDRDELLKVLTLGNKIATINKDYQVSIYNDLLASAEKTIDFITNESKGNFKIIGPFSNKYYHDGSEWMLEANEKVALYEYGYNRTYFELKELKDKNSISKFMKLYVYSLIDISTLNTTAMYHVKLMLNEQKEVKGKYKDRDVWEFDINSERATYLLNEIHRRMGDYSTNYALNIDKPLAKYLTYNDYMNAIKADHGPWEYFSYKDFFYYFKSLGVSREDYSFTNYVKELSRHIELIDFLPDINIEEDFKDE